MAAPIGYRLPPKRPLDKWSTRERLALASSVKKSGDQNWVSVSRAIKPFVESSRPSDWFSQKNCALQYADLLEKAETPKRKRGEKGEREVVETPANQIVRKLTIERIEELKEVIQEEQQRYKKLKKEVEAIRAGKCDGEINEIWENMQAEKKAAEEKRLEEERKLAEDAAERAKAQALRKMSGGIHRTSSTFSSVSEMDESTQDSMPDTLNVETTDDELPTTPTVIQPITIEIPQSATQDTKPAPPTSPLLSSLLQSKQFSVDSLQQIKDEAEANHALKAANQAEALQQLINQQADNVTPDTIQNTTDEQPSMEDVAMATHIKVENEVEVISDVKTEVDVESTDQVIEVESMDIKEEIVECHDMVVEETIEVTTHESPVKTQQPKQETPVVEEVKEVEETVPPTSFVDDEVLVREDPPSPASSISSRVSEAGSKSSSRRSKGGRGSGGARRGSIRSARRSNTDDLSSRPSDADTTDDDGDSSIVLPTSGNIALSESIPNSPHSSHCSDTEDDKAYKSWKKSIMLVWRAAANHKYANVFLHPVTDDIAPGYSIVVKRPKDLTIIKRHIENGTIRTTSEFQRDMMLMFTNAIMYNNANHDVYRMAIEMYNDVLEHIEQYVSTQLMVQNTEAKLLRPTRRNESSDKEEESRRRRTSSEAEGGKSKKRKSRADET
ncbi:bromodomain-containing protein 8-like [Mercenaria mercenaria]|uniref:bromodomain-containing protein 8-like n=1 Tax=Mercenaria mercenaria TaxID=6596 RepID=UPI00234F5AD2|nr:bromodomain-containing protein 8-like [Mercenaria mercenaria]